LLLRNSLGLQSKLSREFREILASFQPDIVHVEQPYLVVPIKTILKDMGHMAVIIHGSQNVERALKSGIYHQILPRKELNYLLKYTKIAEDTAIKQADINIGVSQADARALRQHRQGYWQVVRNGTSHVDSSYSNSNKDKLHSKVIFIGSAHPPNYIGIESLLKDTSFLAKEDSLLLIGGVAQYFRGKYPEGDSFWDGKIAIGQVDEKKLQEYIKQADIIVLPINTGGGSNLKTAEAIGAHKKIVSTSFAFRGYEQYLTLPNVYIANTAGEFKDKLRQALAEVYRPYTNKQMRLIAHLSWDYSLRPLRLVVDRARLILFIRKLKKYIKKA
jgi:glycosyltransferase involved in cell wall biosynthesis